jgi:putative SOS response-associated peptidase YedK
VCGRFVSRTGAAIERYFNITLRMFRLFKSYNVAPGTDIPVIRQADEDCELTFMR